jgi:hypothetical protein
MKSFYILAMVWLPDHCLSMIFTSTLDRYSDCSSVHLMLVGCNVLPHQCLFIANSCTAAEQLSVS